MSDNNQSNAMLYVFSKMDSTEIGYFQWSTNIIMRYSWGITSIWLFICNQIGQRLIKFATVKKTFITQLKMPYQLSKTVTKIR